MIKRIIWDLDNCLFDTHQIPQSIIDPVVRQFESWKSLSSKERQELLDELWTRSLDRVVKERNIPKDIAVKMWAAYQSFRAPKDISVFADVRLIPCLGVRNALVTTGFREYQQSKIDALGIESYFDSIDIDSIDDPNKVVGKKKIFEGIMVKDGLNPLEVLVIGDSATSELKAGRELGMVTVQTLRPRVLKDDECGHRIETLYELTGILELYRKYG